MTTTTSASDEWPDWLRLVTTLGVSTRQLRQLLSVFGGPSQVLAATQVDVHERVIVIDVSEEHNQPRALINPVIEWASSDRIKGEEGCLSVPGIYDGVERAHQVRVSALDPDGQPITIEAEGLESICLQHEIDHLQGKVFVEHLSFLKRTRIRSKILKAQRESQR